MPRGIRVLVIGTVGAVLVALTGAVFVDRAQIQALQRQVTVLNATAASSTRITITHLEGNPPGMTCETILNESGRPLEVRTEVEGTPSDPSRDAVAANRTTVWCVDDRR